jgi:hypothetical protein
VAGPWLLGIEWIRQSPNAISTRSTRSCRGVYSVHATCCRPDGIADDRIRDTVGRMGVMQKCAELIGTISPLDSGDLRGWHYAITGAILLTTSPDSPELMGGRYGWLQDTIENCHIGIRRLKVVLDAWNLKLPLIQHAPDRESQALATATATLWDLPHQEFEPTAEGFVVAYALDAMNPAVYESLSVFAPDRHRSFATRWTGSDQFAADLTTLLVQTVSHPWSSKMRVIGDPLGPPPRQVESIPADDSSSEVLAAQILQTEYPPSDDDISDPELAEFAQVAKLLATAFQARDIATECGKVDRSAPADFSDIVHSRLRIATGPKVFWMASHRRSHRPLRRTSNVDADTRPFLWALGPNPNTTRHPTHSQAPGNKLHVRPTEAHGLARDNAEDTQTLAMADRTLRSDPCRWRRLRSDNADDDGCRGAPHPTDQRGAIKQFDLSTSLFATFGVAWCNDDPPMSTSFKQRPCRSRCCFPSCQLQLNPTRRQAVRSQRSP